MKRCLRDSIYRWGVLLVLLVLGMLGTPTGAAVAADADTLVLALNRDQDNMDPHMHFQRVGIIMNINMYDSLLHKNTKLEYEPSLATAWKTLDDTTWEFTLRQGVKFHNGDPFSAEDVKFSFDRVIDPATKSPQYGNIRAIKEVKIIDAHTVHLITDKPFPLLLGGCPRINAHGPWRLEESGRSCSKGPCTSSREHLHLPIPRSDVLQRAISSHEGARFPC